MLLTHNFHMQHRDRDVKCFCKKTSCYWLIVPLNPCSGDRLMGILLMESSRMEETGSHLFNHWFCSSAIGWKPGLDVFMSEHPDESHYTSSSWSHFSYPLPFYIHQQITLASYWIIHVYLKARFSSDPIGVLGFDSRQELGIFLFNTASRPDLGPTQPPIQWVPGALSLEVKAAEAWSWPFISI
jgi:hypothetical protein